MAKKTKHKCKTFWGTEHSFGKWEVKNRGEILKPSANGEKGVIGFIINQERTCKECGFIECDFQQKTLDNTF